MKKIYALALNDIGCKRVVPGSGLSLLSFGLPKGFLQYLFASVFILLLHVYFNPIFAQMDSQTFTNVNSGTNQSHTFTVPAGVTTIIVEAWGGGGAGGGYNSDSGNGGGGGGGAYDIATINVSPGDPLNIVVGTRGIAAANSGDGGTSTVSYLSTTYVTANGGGGGGWGTPGSAGIGGSGGTYSGGDGNAGINGTGGGGGGGSAGTGTDGNSATSSSGANAVTGGGPGGNGVVGTGHGTAPASGPGGGGGGARETSGAPSSFTGGDGAAGQVIVSWVPAYLAEFTAMDFGSATWCAGEERTVSVTVKNIGQATWTDSSPDVNIGLKWNTDGSSWTDYHLRTDAGNLAPGDEQTYYFNITAANNEGAAYTDDLAPGINNLSFDVVVEAACWFGDNSGICGPGNTVYTSPNIEIQDSDVSDFNISAQPACEGDGSLVTINSTTLAAGVYTVTYDLSGDNSSNDNTASVTMASNTGSFNTIALANTGTTDITITLMENAAACEGIPLSGNTASITVSEPSVGGTVTGGSSSICHGENTGTMTLSGHTGTVNKWQRQLDGGGWADIVNATTTHSEIPASAGTWDYRAEVQNGSCAAEFSGFTSIVVLPRPTAVLSGSGSICLGQAVTLTLSVTAVGDWELNLDNGGGTFTGNGSGSFPAVVYPPTNTTYAIADMFDSQCNSEPGDLTGSATINVDEDCQVIYINAPDPVLADISGDEAICGGGMVTVTVVLSGGTQPYAVYWPIDDDDNDYDWDDNITGVEPVTFTFQVSPGITKTYDENNVFINDANFCAVTVTGSAVITVYDEIEFDVTTNDISCFGASDGEITIEVTQGTGPFEYSIDNGDTYTAPTNTNPYTFSGLGPGDYDIRVKDANGCESPECP